ncbi:MAG: serine/threonine-protein kinase PknK [Planctomycetota bacterium]
MAEILGDRYRIIEKLGEGGMAEVFLVEDALEERPLALKLLKPGEAGSRDYFMHEFRVLARLEHPNLVRVHDFGTAPAGEDGAERCYYTCEYLAGQDLFRATLELDFEGLYDVVRQVLEALAYIHDRGLVHYDVKPENVNVLTVPATRPGMRPQHRVKLVDFGLTGEATTRRGAKIKGTVHYVAPEVAKSLPADRRADLYSLGITLYYVATRELPYDGNSAFSIIRKHIERIPQPPTAIRADVPEAWAAFILRLIEKEPQNRYASAPEALADLSRRLGKPYREAAPSSSSGDEALSPAFVGRAEELDQLVSALPRDDAAPTAVFWLEGEEGVGKTRLLRELKVRAQLLGVPFLHAPCVREGEQPFVRIVRMALTLPAGRELADAHAPALEALFPGVVEAALGRAREPLPLRDLDDLRGALDRAVAFLLALAARAPFALVLEDVRRANEITVGLLGVFLRALINERRGGRDVACLVVLTDRQGEVSAESSALAEGIPEDLQVEVAEDLSEIRRQLGAAGLLTSLALFRLGKMDTAEMVSSMLALPEPPPRLCATIHRATGGNPFFVEELVKSLMDDGVLRLRQAELRAEDLDRIRPPRSLEELLGQRLARLPDDARAVLVALAVLWAPSPLRLVALTSDRSTELTLDALDLLVRRQTVLRVDDEQGGPPRYRMAHGQVQRAVLSSISRRDLEATHRRALGALEELCPEGPERELVVERLARHAHECGELAQALEYASRAGVQAQRQGNPQQAIELLDRALEMLRWDDVVAEDATRGEREQLVLTRLSEVLATVGRYADAARALEELLGLGDERLGEAAVWARRRLGDLALRQGKVAEARRWLEEALQRTTGGPAALRAERARVLEVMSRIALWRGDYLKVISLAGEAVELFRALKRRRDTLWALNILATTEYYRGEVGRAAEHLRECLRLRRADAPDFRGELARLGLGEPELSELDRRLRRFEEEGGAARLVRPAGDAYGLVLSYSPISTFVDLEVDVPAARAFYAASITAYQRLGDAHRTALAQNDLGVYLRHAGRLAQAREELEASLAIHELSHDRQGGAVALTNLALLLLALGESKGAQHRAKRALGVARDIGIVWLTGHCHRVLGRAQAIQGAYAEADRELSRAAGVFRMVGNQRSLADLLVDRAEVCVQARRFPEAAKHLARAEDTGVDPAPDHRGRVRLVQGWVALAEDPTGAVDHFEVGLELARRAGVAELRLDAHRALARAYVQLGTLRLAQQHLDEAQRLSAELADGLDPRTRERFQLSPGGQLERETSRLLLERSLED